MNEMVSTAFDRVIALRVRACTCLERRKAYVVKPVTVIHALVEIVHSDVMRQRPFLERLGLLRRLLVRTHRPLLRALGDRVASGDAPRLVFTQGILAKPKLLDAQTQLGGVLHRHGGSLPRRAHRVGGVPEQRDARVLRPRPPPFLSSGCKRVTDVDAVHRYSRLVRRTHQLRHRRGQAFERGGELGCMRALRLRLDAASGLVVAIGGGAARIEGPARKRAGWVVDENLRVRDCQ